jgi:hypothetical protein
MEHHIFMEGESVTNYSLGVRKFGNNWKKVETILPSRNGTQIRSHAQKFFKRIRKEFKTIDPLTFVQENSFDDFQLYKFGIGTENPSEREFDRDPEAISSAKADTR